MEVSTKILILKAFRYISFLVLALGIPILLLFTYIWIFDHGRFGIRVGGVFVVVIAAFFIRRYCVRELERLPKESPIEIKETDGAGHEGGMDFKMLANFILALGFILVCIGGFKYASNLAVSSQAPNMTGNSPQAMGSFVDQMGNREAADSENQLRGFNRDDALKFIGAGAIVIFVGAAVRLSAKKSRSK